MTTQPYPAQRAERAGTQPDYSGRRHARMTKSMKALPRAVLQILTELHYSIRDGETQTISNAVLAQRSGLSEGFVSAAVRWLAGEAISYVPQLAQPPRHVFIERRLRQDGLPGYEITMLAPPELRPRQVRLFVGDHHRDPLLHSANTASGRSETLQQGDHGSDPPILVMHTENQGMNQESPPNMTLPGDGSAPDLDLNEPAPPADIRITSPAHQTIPPSCDENHQGNEALAPELVAGHQALNPERAIFPGEWWELLEMQAAHGPAQLLIWQARAARRAEGSPSHVLPGYYRACAARAAVDAYRPWRHDHHTPERVPTPNVALSAPVPASPPTPAPRLLLDPACDALLVTMGIRERQALAGVPLPLIEQWAGVLNHAGLAARFDEPLAFAHAQLLRGNAPPSRAELERWAERARKQAASAPLPALTDAQVQTIRERHAALLARAATIAPDDLADEERLALLADLERGMSDAEALERLHAGWAVIVAPEPTPEQICAALMEELRQPLHRRHWSLVSGIRLEHAGEDLRIVCQQVGQIGIVEAQIAPHIRVALRSYAWQPSVRVVATAPPPIAPPSEPQPPVWITPERWATLPGLLRTMLLGSVLEDGELRCVTPSLTPQIQARYSDLLAALLVERHQEADDAAR